MRHMLPAYEFRRRAREAMKPAMSVLVLVTLIAMLPSLISQTITLLTNADPSTAIMSLYTNERMTALFGENAAAALAASDELLTGMKSFFSEKWPIIALTTLLTHLFGPVLSLGYEYTLLKTLRRQDISTRTVLERLPLFFKAIGLNLMLMLRLFLWMLPGMALSMVAAVVLVSETTVGTLLFFVAMILMFVLMIRAMYSYRLSTYVMADVPRAGINAAIRRSKEVMNGRRGELFSLELSFLGWRLLLSVLQTTLLGLLGSVLGMALNMFASMILQMYIYMAEAAFYQEYAVGPLAPPQENAPESEPLN